MNGTLLLDGLILTTSIAELSVDEQGQTLMVKLTTTIANKLLQEIYQFYVGWRTPAGHQHTPRWLGFISGPAYQDNTLQQMKWEYLVRVDIDHPVYNRLLDELNFKRDDEDNLVVVPLLILNNKKNQVGEYLYDT